MLTFELMREKRILIITPEEPLVKPDFERLSETVDSFISKNGPLVGLMIVAKSFPGWKNFSAMIAHFKFVMDHQRHIKRVHPPASPRPVWLSPPIRSASSAAFGPAAPRSSAPCDACASSGTARRDRSRTQRATWLLLSLPRHADRPAGWECELSTVDSAFLLAGALVAGAYFDADDGG